MGVYLKEFSPIKGAKGNQKMTMLIERSHKAKSIYFEVYEDENDWKVYWNYEIGPDQFLPIMSQYANPKITINEAFNNPQIISKISELSQTHIKVLNENEIGIIQDLLNRGFPPVLGGMPQGLDGHSYIFTINGEENEYRSWRVLPKEWEHVKPVIEQLVNIAEMV